jgi:hypothetical protein
LREAAGGRKTPMVGRNARRGREKRLQLKPSGRKSKEAAEAGNTPLVGRSAWWGSREAVATQNEQVEDERGGRGLVDAFGE